MADRPGRHALVVTVGPRAAPAVRLVQALAGAGASLAIAESLTGGAVSAAVVDVPGASAVLRGSVTAYQVGVKRDLLGVPGDVVDTDGVVSAAVAVAMARGVRELLRADVGVGTTGVAGPGPSDGVAGGTVVVAAATGERVVVRRVLLAGGRAAVRAAARDLALAVALAVVDDVPVRGAGLGNTQTSRRVAHSDD